MQTGKPVVDGWMDIMSVFSSFHISIVLRSFSPHFEMPGNINSNQGVLFQGRTLKCTRPETIDYFKTNDFSSSEEM